MKTIGKIAIAAAAGIAAGAVAGILLAPDKGSETRKKLSEGGKKIADTIKDKIRMGKEKCSDLKEDIKEKIKINEEEFA